MALQDLTPQLRTRLSRLEWAVGWFVFLATVLLLFGFGYYIYHTAERKGWFKIKAKFHTYVQSSSGLSIKDPVYMMGFPVGEITSVFPMQPYDRHNVRVEFEIVDPFFRYIWAQGSYVKVNSADFLGKRLLEVTRGTNGPAICVTQPGYTKTIPELEELVVSQPDRWQLYQDVMDENSNVVFGAYTMLTQSNLALIAQSNIESNSVFAYDNTVVLKRVVATWRRRTHRYENFTPGNEDSWLRAVESPAVTEQIQAIVTQVQTALPGILALTNKIAAALDNTVSATSNLNVTVAGVKPMLTNFTLISEQLRDPGGLALWALGTNGNEQIHGSLTNLNSLLGHADTNLDALLTQLAGITHSLNTQVQANSNMLGGIVKTVADADDFVQGLKRHWLLRSAFKTKPTNAPASKR